jgi:hypothetical protein
VVAERREDDDESPDGDEQHGQDASGVVHPSAVVLGIELAVASCCPRWRLGPERKDRTHYIIALLHYY